MEETPKFNRTPDPIKGVESVEIKTGNPQQAILNVIEQKPYTPDELKKRGETYEEREKLADEVCLKYKKGDTFNFNLEKRHMQNDVDDISPEMYWYSVILDDVEIGAFDLGVDKHMIEKDRNNKEKIFYGIQLNKNIENKGLGKQLYILLNEYLKKIDGSVLRQSFESSQAAKGVWLSLFKDGLVEVIPENSPHGYYLSAINHYLPKHLKFYRFKK